MPTRPATYHARLLSSFLAIGEDMERFARAQQRIDQDLKQTLMPGVVVAERFKMIRTLGRGGMGEVYLAEDLHLERPVAIKTLRTDHLATHHRFPWLETFRQEALSTARLQHPNILTVHDFGVHRDMPFMVLEYLEGKPLYQRLGSGPLPLQTTLKLANQLIDALTHAHSQGVIHRDLKPSNIFVLADDRLKVLDFGLALLRPQTHPSPRIAGTDGPFNDPRNVGGTEGYMAPEQLMGNPQDGRTDLWALGVLLFQLLTGRIPFPHHQALISAPEPGADTLPADTPAPLRELVLQCLRRDIDARPADALTCQSTLRTMHLVLEVPDTSMLTAARFATPVDAFMGRRDELTFLRGLLDQRAPLITVAGPAGCGKTRLVRELCIRVAVNIDPIFFCDLSETTHLNGLLTLVGSAMDLSLAHADPSAAIGDHLAERGPTLLVLDNAEHLTLATVTVLASWLHRAPMTSFIVTSRQRLNLPHKQLFTLAPLPLPNEGEDPYDNEAVQLFIRRAREQQAKFSLDARSLADVVTLVRSLDGLPLAIELAAARARILSPDQMLKKMNRRFDLLKSKRRDRNRRQRTMRDTLAWSWDLLEPHEHAALAQASIVPISISLDAAEAILDLTPWPDAPPVIDVLQSLVESSLIHPHPPQTKGPDAGPRFAILSSIREFALAKLHTADTIIDPEGIARSGPTALTQTKRRVCEFFAQLASPKTNPSDEQRINDQRLHLLHLEMDNLVAAIHYALELEDTALTAQLMLGIYDALALRGPFRRGIDILSKILSDPSLTAAVRSRYLRWRGRFFWQLGEGPSACRDLNEALELARHAGIRQTEGSIIGNLAMIAHRQGDLTDARTGYQAAITLAQQNDNRHSEGVNLGNLAALDALEGRSEDARTGFRDALAIARERNDARFESIWLGELAMIDRTQGAHEAAYEGLSHARRIARRLGDTQAEAVWTGELGAVALDQEHLDRSRQHLEHADTLLRALNSKIELVSVLCTRSRLALACNNADTAREFLNEATQIAAALTLGDESELMKKISRVRNALNQRTYTETC